MPTLTTEVQVLTGNLMGTVWVHFSRVSRPNWDIRDQFELNKVNNCSALGTEVLQILEQEKQVLSEEEEEEGWRAG